MQKDHNTEKEMASFCTNKTRFEASEELTLHVAYLRKPVPFLFIILSSYLSVVVSVNFTAFVGERKNHHGHGSQFKSSQFGFFFFPFCGMRNRQHHGANLRPIVGPAIVGSMKGAFKSLFLLNCFASAFQRGILSPALHETISGDETSFLPFFPVQMSDIKEMNSVHVCMCVSVCVFFWEKSSAPAFVRYMGIKGLRERREGPVVFLMVCVCVCVCYWPPGVALS